MSNIGQYLPHIYKGVTETDCLMEAENSLFDELLAQITKVENNEFIQTADSETIYLYENMLGIVSNDFETLDFRRQRILNRLSTDQVFTMRSLELKLNQIIGAGAWQAYIEPEAPYILVVESSATNQNWYHELLVTINNAKPANIVFVNKAYIPNTIDINEGISYSQLRWNYQLGISWELGRLPFSSLSQMGEIKSMSTPSINQSFLNDITTFNSQKITKVKINNAHIITAITKQTEDNVLQIEYNVPMSLGITEITNVKLLDSSDNVLTEALIYVPMLTDIILKHRLLVVEG